MRPMLLLILLAPLLASDAPAASPIQPRWLRVRDSLPVLLGTGLLWALVLAGQAAALDRPGAGSWLGWLLAGWLLVVPGPVGLYFGRWAWLLPVVAGLGALAWIAPVGLDSRLGNLTLPAVICAFASAAMLTSFGVALRPSRRAGDDGDEQGGSQDAADERGSGVGEVTLGDPQDREEVQGLGNERDPLPR